MKVSVICAPQTFGCNAGMFSVDLAAWYFLQKNFPGALVEFITLYPHQCDFSQAPFRFVHQDGEIKHLEDSNVILYWGDFLHTLPYRDAVVSQLVAQGKCKSIDEALEKVRKFLFLAESDPELLKKTILYGGTLLFNQANSYENETYANDLKRLIVSAKRVWVREPFSAFKVNQLQGYEQHSAHGTDCAQLLRKDFVKFCSIGAGYHSSVASRKKLGIYIGRSHFETNKIGALVSGLQTNMKLDLSWLDWGKPPFFLDKKRDVLKCLPQLEKNGSAESALTSLEALLALQEVDLLVSDTYHTCVNAWNFGIPAICLIDNSSSALKVNNGSAAAGRDKRVVFYWTYNVAPFLVYSSDLCNETAIQKKADEISSLLADQALLNHIFKQMSQHVQVSEELLLRAIKE